MAAAGSVVVAFQSTNEDDIITDGDNPVIIVVVVVDAVVDPDGGRSLCRDIDAKAVDAAVAAGHRTEGFRQIGSFIVVCEQLIV